MCGRIYCLLPHCLLLTFLHILFLFLDGVGLGAADAAANPFVTATIPTLMALCGGQRPLAATPRTATARALFIPTDAGLGVAGPPQSATGQATIVTGQNAPQLVGGHWGPKPNAAVAAIIQQHSVFSQLVQRGRTAALLNAYPQRYFDVIQSKRRSYSAIPLAVTTAGLPLKTLDDLRAGQAFSADFTGAGWHTELGYTDTPVYGPREAGQHIARVARNYDFAFFEHWPSDYIGHRGDLTEARQHLELLDAVLAGMLEAWDDEAGLIVVTSDHGNLEDVSHPHHTLNPVPTFVIGAARHVFARQLTNLTHFAPAILEVLA